MQLAGFHDVLAAHVVDADLSTITAQADKIIQIDDPHPWLMHIEFQSSDDTNIGLRLCRYNVLVEYRHNLPVLSVLVLLTPDADSQSSTGRLRRTLPNGSCYDEFQYQVIRVWELPVELVLRSGLGTLPLAPLSGVPDSQIPDIIKRVKHRVDHEIEQPDQRKIFWEATTILLGMRLPFEQIEVLIQGIANMKESSVIQWYLKEGRLEGAHEILIQLAERHFGNATPEQRSQLEALSDLKQITELTDQIHDLHSWDELLAAAKRLQFR